MELVDLYPEEQQESPTLSHSEHKKIIEIAVASAKEKFGHFWC